MPLSAYSADPATVAKQYLYVREIKPNRSPEIDAWNRYVGNPLGAQYCSAFVSYVAGHSDATLKIKSGLARRWFIKTTIRAGQVLIKKMVIPPNYVVIWARGNTIYGHAAITTAYWIRGKGMTIEANTSSGVKGSQHDGTGVFERYRKIEPYNYFRIIGFTQL